jgi:hypothetical protein
MLIYERLHAVEVGPDLRAGRFYGEVREFRANNADGPLGDRTQPGAPDASATKEFGHLEDPDRAP